MAVGAGGAFRVGENEFGALGDMPFSFGGPGGALFDDGAGADVLGALVVVLGSSLVVLVHPESALTPMIAAPPAANTNRPVSRCNAMSLPVLPETRPDLPAA